MRAAEEDLARGLAAEEGALVVADGPLTFQGTGRGAALGYVKRLHQLYLPGSGLALLAALRPGTRTPLFALRSRRFGRYAWFLRLSTPARADSDLAGIARLEVADGVGLETARRLADATSRALPLFAPSRGRDPRAPQNLLPVGALETRLRHALGDAALIRRSIETVIAREASRV